MIINSVTLAAVRTGFSAAYARGLGQAESQYKRIATVVPSSTKDQTYGWLGKLPQVREWVGSRMLQNLKQHAYTITEKKWELTIPVDRDDIETDNIGVYTPLFEEMGLSSSSHWDQLCWGLLKLGFDTDCYDGQRFFDTDHPVIDENGSMTTVANTDGGSGTPWFLLDISRALKPIILQRRKDFKFVAKDKETDDNVFDNNEFLYGTDARANVGFGFWQFAWGSKQPLTPDNYATARAAISGMKGDHGRPLGLKPNLLVVPPSLESAGRKIVSNSLTTGGATNEWAGTAELLQVPWLA